jgi:hypothetical protein
MYSKLEADLLTWLLHLLPIITAVIFHQIIPPETRPSKGWRIDVAYCIVVLCFAESDVGYHSSNFSTYA